MLKARDVMSRQAIIVTKETPIVEALELLVKKRITCIPVVEYDMTLVGILAEKDVLGLFYTHEEYENKTVGSLMTPIVVHFDQNEALPTVCESLRKYSIKRIPVTSKGKVVGIISGAYIIEYILRQWQVDTMSTGGT